MRPSFTSTRAPIVEFKAGLIRGGRILPQRGNNELAYPWRQISRTIYPHFFEDAFTGRLTRPRAIQDEAGDCTYRMYLPAGYDENPLRRYPVLYMQDGSNLFAPDEAFGGREAWTRRWTPCTACR
ncbi:MAG: hypothetical protein IPK67_19465 [Planctomycetes bacterium]|nr:hypothetical protein [Planctomycetota bacterium]